MSETSGTEPWRGIGDDWEVLPGVTGGEILSRLEAMDKREARRWWIRNARLVKAVTPGLLGNASNVLSNDELNSTWKHLTSIGEQHPKGPHATLLAMVQTSGGIVSFMDHAPAHSGERLIRAWANTAPSVMSPLGVLASEAMLKTDPDDRLSAANILAGHIASRFRDVDDVLALQAISRMNPVVRHSVAFGVARSAEVARVCVEGWQGASGRLAAVLRWPAAREDEHIRKMVLGKHLTLLSAQSWRDIFNTLDGPADIAFMLEVIWAMLELELRAPKSVDPETAADFEEYREEIYRKHLSREVLILLSQHSSASVRRRALLEAAPRLVDSDDPVAGSPESGKTSLETPRGVSGR